MRKKRKLYIHRETLNNINLRKLDKELINKLPNELRGMYKNYNSRNDSGSYFHIDGNKYYDF